MALDVLAIAAINLHDERFEPLVRTCAVVNANDNSVALAAMAVLAHGASIWFNQCPPPPGRPSQSLYTATCNEYNHSQSYHNIICPNTFRIVRSTLPLAKVYSLLTSHNVKYVLDAC